MKKLLLFCSLFLLSIVTVSGQQKLKLKLGFELISELYGHAHGDNDIEDEISLFQYNYSVDANYTVGERLDLTYGKLGIGAGLNVTSLGFTKNNEDSSSRVFNGSLSQATDRPAYLYKSVRYRSQYIEVPIRLFFKTSSKDNHAPTIGITYSFLWNFTSSLNVSTYGHNINRLEPSFNPEVAETALNEGTVESLRSLAPYLECPVIHTEDFTFSCKLGMRFLSGSYHNLLLNRPTSVFFGITGVFK